MYMRGVVIKKSFFLYSIMLDIKICDMGFVL